MTTLDFVLLGFLALSLFYGFRMGLIHMAGTFLGMLVGVVLAGRWYEGVGQWLAPILGLNPLFANVVAFFLVMSLANRIVGLAFTIVDKALKLVKILPFIGTFDKLGGAILGLLEGIITLGLTLYLASKYDISPSWRDSLSQSVIVPILIGVSQIIVPLLPQALKQIQSVITKNVP